MKFTAAVLISATAVSAFTPSGSIIQNTALHSHTLGGWTPLGAPVFSGFGHSTGPMGVNNSPFNTAAVETIAVAATAPAAATAPMGGNNSPFGNAVAATPIIEATQVTSSAPVFSAFGHSIESIGGNPSTMGATTSAAAPAAAAGPAAPVFPGFGTATGEMTLSGFGHSIDSIGGSARTMRATTSAVAPAAAAAPAAPVFPGFGHAIEKMGENSGFAQKTSSAPVFSGFGHSRSRFN